MCGGVPAALGRCLGDAARKGTGLGTTCAWQPDADVLLAFKAAVEADPRNWLASWQAGTSPSATHGWRGISCTGTAVTSVNLTGVGMSITSLEPLAGLQAVQSLAMSGNNVHGSLPDSWSQLVRLVQLDLSGTGVAGSIPASWGQLGRLQHLHLGRNALDGQLPLAWASLTSLQTL